MKIDKEAAFFRQIFLFQDLEDQEIEQVLSRTSLREFPAGSGHHPGRRAG